MKRDDFDHRIKGKLYDHEADVPPLCWDAIEKKLPQKRDNKRYIWWMSAGVAAIALLFVTVDFLTKEMGGNVEQPVALVMKERQPAPVFSRDISAKSTDIVIKQNHKKIQVLSSKHHRMNSLIQPVNTQSSKTDSVISEPVVAQATASSQQENMENSTLKTVNAEKEIEAFIQDGKAATEAIESEIRRAGAEKGAIRLLAGLAGETNGQTENPARMMRTVSASTGQITKMLNSASLNDDGKNASNRYSVPLSFGLMVEKRIWKKLTIETGLCYTYLRSEQDLNSSPFNGKHIQELHYLGIPVRLGYDVMHLKNITLYCRAGGQVEKNIAGRWREAVLYDGKEVYSRLERDLEDKLQWSLSFSPGVHTRLVRNFYIYAETPLNYYIDNQSNIINIRKARNIEVSLQVGLRAAFTTN